MRNRTKWYLVKYKMYSADDEKNIYVRANGKEDAYETAVYSAIPEKENDEFPYSAWVYGFETKEGKLHRFNTCEGLAY